MGQAKKLWMEMEEVTGHRILFKQRMYVHVILKMSISKRW